MSLRLTCTVALALLGTALCAPPVVACADLQAERGWVRLPPPGAPTAAAYFDLVNHGNNTSVVVAVSSPRATRTMLHETRYVEGRAQMRHLDRVTIGPGETFRAAPGGAHVMLGIGDDPLAPDDIVEIVLECADGERTSLWLPVRRAPPD